MQFDRGTILLDVSRGQVAELNVPSLRWDPRVGRFRAPACCYPELARSLARQGQKADSPLCHAGQRPRVCLRQLSLRPYQEAALAAWEAGGCRGIVVLPTGSGKTHVALTAAARLGRSVIILVPTRVLLEQWVARVRSVYDGSVGVVGDGNCTIHPVTVCTFESAFRQMDRFGHLFDLLVADEVHHFASGARAEALEMCVAPARLGLSATPPLDAEGLSRLQGLVGPVVFRRTIRELAGAHLAPLDHLCLFAELSGEERHYYERERAVFTEIYGQMSCTGRKERWAELVRLAARSEAGRQALRSFHAARRVVATARAKLAMAASLLHQHFPERTLLFTADNTAAYALSRQLLVPAVTCHMQRKERALVLRALHEGRIRAVVSARVLNEGIDLPDARVGIITGGALGSREHVQRVGRLLRPGPGKRATVYEIVAQDTYEVRHASDRQRHLLA